MSDGSHRDGDEADAPAGGVELAPEQLSRDALRGLIQEFVTRDGTDYGAVESPLAAKIAAVERQLANGEARIVFDPETETTNIVLARDL